jgi:hypothetical protein
MKHPSRRLSDKIMKAHEQACTEGKRTVAELLLNALEVDLSAIGGSKQENRHVTEELEQAFKLHERAMAKFL